MPAPQAIAELVERFSHNLDAYRSGAYKEVIHEDALKIGGATKAPDYCFRIGGTRRFFVEARKPWVDIALDPLSTSKQPFTAKSRRRTGRLTSWCMSFTA